MDWDWGLGIGPNPQKPKFEIINFSDKFLKAFFILIY